MKLTQLNDGETLIRRYEYADRWVVAADLGVADDQVTVDTVDDTAIVVIERDGDAVDAETEFDLPGPAANVDVNNGVLTIGIDK